MSNGIGDLMADTAVGMFSGERRLDNFISRRDKERERELAAAKIKALDLMSPAYKAKLMKDQGVRDPLYLDIGSSTINIIELLKMQMMQPLQIK